MSSLPKNVLLFLNTFYNKAVAKSHTFIRRNLKAIYGSVFRKMTQYYSLSALHSIFRRLGGKGLAIS